MSDMYGMSSTENEFMANFGLIKISKSSLAKVQKQNDIDQVLLSEGLKYKLFGTKNIKSFYKAKVFQR